VEGSGHAEYSINGSSFQTYTVPVEVNIGSDVTVRAVADPGYSFAKWTTPATVTSASTSFNNVQASLHLGLYFSEGNGNGNGGNGDNDGKGLFGGDNGWIWWLIAAILLILLIGLLWWFLIFWRRYYDVYLQDVRMIGKDRTPRKKAYVFTIEGGYGAIAYRVKEDGEWKQVFPNADGEYVIPKDEVIGDIWLEMRVV